jgi:hypothetical protein
MSSKSKSTAQPAHPSTEGHDDTVLAHYASLERPHACIGGWVTMGQIVIDPETGEVDRGVRDVPLPQVRGAKLGRGEYRAGRGILRGALALENVTTSRNIRLGGLIYDQEDPGEGLRRLATTR